MGLTVLILVVLLDVTVIWHILHSLDSLLKKWIYSLIVIIFPIIGVPVYYLLR